MSVSEKAAVKEAFGSKGDELKPNASGEYEIWSSLGLYNTADMIYSGLDKDKIFYLLHRHPDPVVLRM